MKRFLFYILRWIASGFTFTAILFVFGVLLGFNDVISILVSSIICAIIYYEIDKGIFR